MDEKKEASLEFVGNVAPHRRLRRASENFSKVKEKENENSSSLAPPLCESRAVQIGSEEGERELVWKDMKSYDEGVGGGTSGRKRRVSVT